MSKSPLNNKRNLRYGIRRATFPWLRAVTENWQIVPLQTVKGQSEESFSVVLYG